MTTYKVYKNQPFNVKIIKDRYWDMTINKSISADMAETVNLLPYDGVPCSINHNASAPLLFVESGTLPDNSIFDAVYGCLMPEGGEYLISSRGYYDIPCSDGLTVDYETGLAEGFSAGNSISLGQCLSGTEYTVIQKAYYDGEAREQTIWLAESNKNVGINGNKLGVYITSQTLGESVLESGIYWFQAVYAERTFKLYWLKDDNETYTLDTLPDVSGWTEEVVLEDCDSPLACSSTLKLSRNSETYWGGKLYLDGARIILFDVSATLAFPKSRNEICKGMLAAGVSCDGLPQVYNIFYKDRKFVADIAEAKAGYRWCGSAAMRGFDSTPVLKKRYAKYGTPAFTYPHLSGFDANSYVVTDKALPQGQFFPVNIKIICKCNTNVVTTDQTLFSDNSANSHGFGIRYNDWRICGNSTVYGGKAEKGKIYWLQVVQESGVGTKMYYLLDDGSYTLETLPDVADWSAGPTTSELIFDNSGQKIRIGTGFNAPNEYWTGSIDLLNTCIYAYMQGSQSEATDWMVYWKPFA